MHKGSSWWWVPPCWDCRPRMAIKSIMFDHVCTQLTTLYKETKWTLQKQQANKNSRIQFQRGSIFKIKSEEINPHRIHVYLPDICHWLFMVSVGTLPKLTFSHLKMDCWNTSLLFGMAYFQGDMLVSGRVHIPFPNGSWLPSPRLHGSAPCWDDPWPCSTSPALHCWKRYSPGSWNSRHDPRS